MSNSLIINSSNAGSGNQKNTFTYYFKSGKYQINKDAEIAISNVTIPYSWFNITNSYGNNTFQFTWTVGVTKTTYTITLPDGFYSVTDINNYFQQYCIQNGFYLVSAGQNVYYMNISYNTNYYAVQVNTFVVPTSLPSGYTQPSNFAGYPTSATAVQFILPLTNSISSIIGFVEGQTYGTGLTTAQSFLSTTTPQGTIVNSIVMRCSLVDNMVTNPPDILDSMPITSTFGSNINYVPNFEKWIKIREGNYSQLILTFYDQNLNVLNMTDTNILVTLLIRQK